MLRIFTFASALEGVAAVSSSEAMELRPGSSPKKLSTATSFSVATKGRNCKRLNDMARYLTYLRKGAWFPTFRWVADLDEAALTINQPHEDFPHRVEATLFTIENQFLSPSPPRGWLPIHSDRLLRIHRHVFGDEDFAGRWRDVRVRIGDHLPPEPEFVPDFMEKLWRAHWFETTNIAAVQDWYWDFETIHPFQDGNGRVGGIILASYSHAWFPNKGYLVPEQ